MVVRHFKLRADGWVWTVRPSFVLPYGVGRTEAVEKALYLRQFGVPFEALAYVFGRDASYWERLWLALGRNAVVGTTVKDATQLPRQLVADEKISWRNGQEVCVTATAGGNCLLGLGLAKEASAVALQAAYGEFKCEAQELDAAYTPETVCTNGFAATRLAWQTLSPATTLILCFLHGILKVTERCRGALRETVLERGWHCYHAVTAQEFSQRLRRLHEWAERSLSGPCKTWSASYTRSGRATRWPTRNRRRHALAMRWIGSWTRPIACCTRGATCTANERPLGWRCARWCCNGTFIPTVRVGATMIRRGTRPLRI